MTIKGIHIYIVSVLLIAGMVSCKKNNNQIPLVVVDKQINVNNPSYYQVQVVGGWMYLTGGSKGLILYRYSTDEFKCYDRHSPYEPDQECVVAVDSSNIEVSDPCSGSRFSLFDGSILQGPANFPLKQYQTSFDGQILRIYN